MYKVADNREYNKMDPRNLAIVLTPSIFSITVSVAIILQSDKVSNLRI